jgi:transposase
MDRIFHGYGPAAKTSFTLVSVYPFCSMVPGVFGYPIGDAIPFRRFIELGRPGPERTKYHSREVAMKQYGRKRKAAPQKKSGSSSFPMINKDAAGIDIGSEEHWVAVPEDRDEEPVRSFGCFTADLHAMARWLKKCGVTTVAMESTGVYWIPCYQILEQHGFEVKLVNARHVKNVPGRKSDVSDCQWLQRLHTYGLLSGSFRPDDQICVLRSYWRHRDNLVRMRLLPISRTCKRH